MDRYLKSQVVQDLDKKMVFLGGPRQAGKTTLAKSLLGPRATGYLNWDDDQDRTRILDRDFPRSALWVFDELHKYRRWRGFLKGLFDKVGKSQKILVTGSARLDLYRFGGDSLQGRYHYLRLHPLSVAELGLSTQADFEQLMLLGGFPEPFLSGSEKEARRWSREYRQRLIREDVSQLEAVQDLATLELLGGRLPDMVGSPLSINALREDLQTSHKTMAKWLTILEKIYHIFRLAPLGSPKIRAVKKEQKHYHFDWSVIPEEGFRFENVVASHLLKWCHFQEDTEGHDCELRYFRDTDGREVDFVVVKDRNPILFVECKLADTSISKSLAYLKAKFPEVRAVQVIARTPKEFRNDSGIEVRSAVKFLRELV